ncbi:putative reverse transcriptase domain-containing protein [Tanacetum coccineum]|uniref:Reverse transcriptase domain-containing protein n=1 Tax=Tanacetum coccineum TaxID=301880 RepID=A0ABQ5BDM0_9ASTR
MVRAGHAAYTNRFHELARLVPHLISGVLTDEAVRNGSIKKIEKTGNVGEPIKAKNGRDDNTRTRTRNAFATTANPVGRENTCTWPKCTTCNSYHAPGGPCRTCFNYNRPGHLAKDHRGVAEECESVNARNNAKEKFIEKFSKIAKSLTILTQKCKTFDWGEDLEISFQTLKDKLYNAPVLALPDGLDMILGLQTEVCGDGLTYAILRKVLDAMISRTKEVMGLLYYLDQYRDSVFEHLAAFKEFAMYFGTKAALGYIVGNYTIWVIMDRLTKSAHFLPMCEDYKMDRLYLNEISMQEALGTRLDMSTAYHPQTDGQSERHYSDLCRGDVLAFEALYVIEKCHSLIMWAEVREGQLIGPELVQETTEKISQIKDKLKAAHDHQKSYADKRRKPPEFSVGDYVLLKVSPWKVWLRLEPVEILGKRVKTVDEAELNLY